MQIHLFFLLNAFLCFICVKHDACYCSSSLLVMMSVSLVNQTALLGTVWFTRLDVSDIFTYKCIEIIVLPADRIWFCYQHFISLQPVQQAGTYIQLIRFVSIQIHFSTCTLPWWPTSLWYWDCSSMCFL